MIKKVLYILLPALFLGGCFNGDLKTDSLGAGITTNNQNPVMINTNLPKQKLVITSGNNRHEFEVEIASTDAQRRVGLMNRENLEDGKGMLFAFEKQGYVNFWMKNTLIPLDMLFMNEEGLIESITKNAPPCTALKDVDCPKYNSQKPVRYVLEIKGGLTDKLAIRVGDKATWL